MRRETSTTREPRTAHRKRLPELGNDGSSKLAAERRALRFRRRRSAGAAGVEGSISRPWLLAVQSNGCQDEFSDKDWTVLTKDFPFCHGSRLRRSRASDRRPPANPAKHIRVLAPSPFRSIDADPHLDGKSIPEPPGVDRDCAFASSVRNSTNTGRRPCGCIVKIADLQSRGEAMAGKSRARFVRNADWACRRKFLGTGLAPLGRPDSLPSRKTFARLSPDFTPPLFA
jgi:hypothetical protein